MRSLQFQVKFHSLNFQPGHTSPLLDQPHQCTIANLQIESTQIKNDTCATVDACIQTVCTELREELPKTKEIGSSI